MHSFKLILLRLVDRLPLTLALVIFAFFALVLYSHAATEFRTDSLVRILEQQQGMYPGSTKVLPQCNCTIKYLGTKIDGHVYEVFLDKLD